MKIMQKKYKGKIYRHAVLVEGFREGKKVSQRIVRNLGPVKNEEDELHYREIVSKVKQGDLLFALSEANKIVFEYGVKLIVENIWNSLEIRQFLSSSKVTYDLNKLICGLIAHRLHNYGSENLSEREGVRWLNEECYSDFKINLHQVYRGIRILLDKKDEIEKHLYKNLHNSDEAIFYDLTSSYLEGEYEKSKIVEYGYNRDKKLGKMQIVLGLLLSDNLPLAHKVWEGNTPDKSTLKEAVTQAKNIGIKKFIFVADRGLITKENLEWIEEQELEYIIATKRRKETLIKQLMDKEIKTGEEIKKVHEEKISETNTRRYYLCYNENVAKEKISDLEEIKSKMIEKIKNIKEPTEHKVLEALGKLKKLFNISFKNGFEYSINEKNYNYEKLIAGKYILVTNNPSLSEKEILGTYKQLMEIERCFRQLKHFLDMRPIFHKKDEGIKAHVFIAVLSLLIEKLINKKITDMTTREVITEMKKLKVSQVSKYFVRTDITPIQNEILSKLKIPEITKII